MLFHACPSTAQAVWRSRMAGGNAHPALSMDDLTMTTLTLTFNGPPSQARRALGGLLQRFRSAYFVERSTSEFAVTADDITAAELAKQPQWSILPVQARTRR
jgi:hypothetical protein